ncbi:hypothetical protein [Stratiformator vulcanicus]|uniref:Uncharacterized protein n=1 Tax=Stratiformator vulcanicus TaxID=2527980 RepID=A0A517QWS6_9PLAN|nr:hypothetical protein [Stratiformator vulcanicus]QDT36047.1 hypothetical protein Pan189_04020 [Stratiformator vulcanicus]
MSSNSVQRDWEIEYESPSGHRIQNPPASFIRRTVYEHDTSYWESGSGQGAFSCVVDGTVLSELTLTRGSESEFRLIFFNKVDKAISVAISDGKMDEYRLVFDGGAFYREPARIFISLEKTFKGLKEYVNSGRCPSSLDWDSWYGLDWPGRDEEVLQPW